MPSATRRAVGARVARGVAFVALFVQPGATLAAAWFAEPTISFGAEKHSNITLTTGEHDDVTVLRATPAIRLGTQTEAASTDVNASVNVLRYPGNDGLDRESFNAGAATRYDGDQVGGRYGYNAGINFAQESLLDTNLILNPDVGLAQTAVTRRTSSLSGGFRWSLSPYTSAQIRGSWSDTKYSDDPLQQFFDFKSYAPELEITWIATDRLRLVGSLSYANSIFPDTNSGSLPPAPQRLSEPDNHTESRTTSGQLGARYALTPKMDINASVGGRNTQTDSVQYQTVAIILGTPFFDNVTVESESSGTVYDLTYSWRPDEHTQLDITAGQNVTPSGQSAGLLARSFRGVYSYSLTERLSLGLTLNKSRVRSDAGTINFVGSADRDYFRGDARVSYRLSETWRLDASYSRARQQYVNTTDVATNDFVGMTLAWTPLRRYFSR